MPTLSVTFRDRTRAVFEGSEDRIAHLRPTYNPDAPLSEL